LSPYTTLKVVHVAAVALSGLGFVVRYGLSVRGRLAVRGWLNVAPHAIDTVLLASALALAWIGGYRILHVPWLQAKVAGLVLYILAGTFALKRGRTTGVRTAAFVAALAIYAYIVSVALTKSPLGLLAGGMA
jgi:uncharacterized membrane protein SirB2